MTVDPAPLNPESALGRHRKLRVEEVRVELVRRGRHLAKVHVRHVGRSRVVARGVEPGVDAAHKFGQYPQRPLWIVPRVDSRAVEPPFELLAHPVQRVDDALLGELWKAYKRCIRAQRTGPAAQLLNDIAAQLAAA